MDEIRVGLFGTGWINSVHAKAVQKLPGVRVTALYNHNPQKAHDFNTKHTGGGAEVFDSFQKMLDAEMIDVLYVAIPPGAHNGEVEAAAAKGIHLMLEKPIALSMERANSIATAIRDAGVLCQIGHHMRHTGPAMKLKKMIDDGSAGRPVLMQGHFFVNGLFSKWWRDPKLGGGQLVEQSIHLYDLARYLFGDAQTVCGFADNLVHRHMPDYTVDDVSASTIRFANGAIASLCAANAADPIKGSIAATVLCEKVCVTFRGFDEATFVNHGGRVGPDMDPEAIVREEVKSDVNCYDELSANFLGAIRGTERLRSDITDGVEGLRLVLAAAASSVAGGMPQSVG